MTASWFVKYISCVRWLSPILLIVVLLMSTGAATSHDPGTAQNATEAAVFRFYASWFRPPERKMSCCSLNDCHTVQVKREGERYYFLDNIYAHGWRFIPAERLEQNAADPRESPDGSNHVCFNQMYVLCAVLGSGQ